MKFQNCTYTQKMFLVAVYLIAFVYSIGLLHVNGYHMHPLRGSSSMRSIEKRNTGIILRAEDDEQQRVIENRQHRRRYNSRNSYDRRHGKKRNAGARFRNDKSNSYSSNNSSRKDVGLMTREVDRVLSACRGEVRIAGITEINHAIITAGRLRRVEDAMTIFRSLSLLGFTPDLMSYNNAIWCAGNGGRPDLAKTIFNELLENQRLKPNVYTYGSLLHACAKSKNYQLALKYLKQMDDLGIEPNQVVFTSAMEACAMSGRYKEALMVMDKMKRKDLVPDLTMVNAAIKACCLGGAMDEAEELASTLREYGAMDLFTYHTLMMGNTKLDRHQRVIVLYEEAVASNAKLDGGIYSLAMLASLNAGLYQQVPRIADQARVEGIPLTEASYTILMQALGEAGGGEQAVACLDDMVHEGLRPNVISYAAAMAACRDKPDTVLQLLDRMNSDNIVPNTVVLTTAINALAREGGKYTDIAYDILQTMERDGPEPNIYTYNTITRAFAEAGRLDDAMNMLENIKQRRLSPDRFTFTTLLMACGRNQKSEEVSRVMGLMKEAGIIPDEITYGAVIDAHRRNGNSLLAIECLKEMQAKNIEPSAAHYNLVLRTLKAAGYAEKMYRMLVGLSANEGSKINVNSYELTIEALLDANMWREALLIVKLMNQCIFQPSLETCTRVVEALEKARQYKAVLAMYRLMDNYGYDFYENDVLNGIFKNIVNVAAKGVNADKAIPFSVDVSDTSQTKKQVKVLSVELNESLEQEAEKIVPIHVNEADEYGEIDSLVSLSDL